MKKNNEYKYQTTIEQILNSRKEIVRENQEDKPNYFNLYDYLNLKYFSTYVFITMRNIGKTTSAFQFAQDVYRNSGEYIVWLRSSNEEIRSVIKDFKTNPPYGWDENYKLFGSEVIDIKNNKLVLKFASLSTVHNMASIKGDGCFGIIFDEFLPRSNRVKISYKALVDFIKTLERKNLLTVILLANATTYQSEILIELGINQELEVWDDLGKRLRYRRITKWDNPPNLKEVSTAYLLSKDSQGLTNYMYGAEFLKGNDDKVIPLFKLGEIRWLSNYLVSSVSVSLGYSDQNKVWVFADGTRNDKLPQLNLTPEDTLSKANTMTFKRTDKFIQNIIRILQSKNYYHTNFEVKEAMEKLVLKYIPRSL